MEKAIVATACVSDVSALTYLLTNLQFSEQSYYLLQSPNKITDWTDWKEEDPDTAKIEKYTHGRLFDKNREIRWKEIKGGYSLLWLSEKSLPEGFTKQGEWEISAPQKVFLLGGGETEPWRDTRIPRKLKSPFVEWCQYPKVSIIQYRDLKSQTIRFTRYTAFLK